MTEFEVDPGCVGRWYAFGTEIVADAYQWAPVNPADAAQMQIIGARDKNGLVRFLSPGTYCLDVVPFEQVPA